MMMHSLFSNFFKEHHWSHAGCGIFSCPPLYEQSFPVYFMICWTLTLRLYESLRARLYHSEVFPHLNHADTTSIWSKARTIMVSVTYSPRNELPLEHRLKNHGILLLMEFLAWQAFFFFYSYSCAMM